MALAFTLITRIDLHVYVVALQRHTSAPTAGHVRKLNTLVRWAQQNPLRIRYGPMKCAGRLEVHSDAAFRKEQKEGVDAGRALRGATFLRLGLTSDRPSLSHTGNSVLCKGSPPARVSPRVGSAGGWVATTSPHVGICP